MSTRPISRSACAAIALTESSSRTSHSMGSHASAGQPLAASRRRCSLRPMSATRTPAAMSIRRWRGRCRWKFKAPVTTAVLPARMVCAGGIRGGGGSRHRSQTFNEPAGGYSNRLLRVSSMITRTSRSPRGSRSRSHTFGVLRDVLAGGNDVEVVLDIEVQVAVVVEVEPRCYTSRPRPSHRAA